MVTVKPGRTGLWDDHLVLDHPMDRSVGFHGLRDRRSVMVCRVWIHGTGAGDKQRKRACKQEELTDLHRIPLCEEIESRKKPLQCITTRGHAWPGHASQGSIRKKQKTLAMGCAA